MSSNINVPAALTYGKHKGKPVDAALYALDPRYVKCLAIDAYQAENAYFANSFQIELARALTESKCNNCLSDIEEWQDSQWQTLCQHCREPVQGPVQEPAQGSGPITHQRESRAAQNPNLGWFFWQCAFCTGASAQTPVTDPVKCTSCFLQDVHPCATCSQYKVISTCFLCTERPHVCLSKCNNGCVTRERPACRCAKNVKNALVRSQQGKSGSNFGRYFWYCGKCSFFKYEDECAADVAK